MGTKLVQPSGIPDAPSDGNTYGRKDANWTVAGGGGGISDAPVDGSAYSRKNANWESAEIIVTNTFYIDNRRIDAYTPTGAITKPFKSINAALSGVVSPSDSNRYLLKVSPNKYNEQITLKPFVQIDGEAVDSVIIHYDGDVVIAGAGMSSFGSIIQNCTTSCESADPTKTAIRCQTGGNLVCSNVFALCSAGIGTIVEGGFFTASNFGILSATDGLRCKSGAYLTLTAGCTLTGLGSPYYDLVVEAGGDYITDSSTMYINDRVSILGIITLHSSSSNIKNDSLVPGITVTDALNSLVIPSELVNRTIYIATTGNDITGDGTIGLPYYSLHKAIENIGHILNGTTITILIADGIYDYSTMNDLIIDKEMIVGGLGTTTGIKIKSQADINSAFTIEDSGTFSALVDIDSNIHIDTSKSWTIDEHSGKFLRIKTINSGSLPSNGDGVSYTYRIIPILRNGIDWIETGFVQGGLSQSQDIATYDIVIHNVILNFGTKYISISDATNGVLNFYGLKIVSTGRFNVGYDHTIRGNHMDIFAGIYNTHISCLSFNAIDSYLLTSYLSVTYLSILNVVEGSVLTSSYTTNIQKFEVIDIFRDSVVQNTAINKSSYLIYFNDYVTRILSLQNRCKFINMKYAMNSCYMSISARLYFDNISFMVDASYPFDAILVTPSSIVFKNEPLLGRMSYDDTTPATTYHNLTNTFNYALLDPSGPIIITAASELQNDSNKAGVHIADALTGLDLVYLPIASFSGLEQITVNTSPPTLPTIGDVWIDSGNGTTLFITGPQTLSDLHDDIVCNSVSGFTVNLPTAVAAYVGKRYNIKNIGAGDIIVSSEVNIDSTTSATVSQWQCITVLLIDLGAATYIWIII